MSTVALSATRAIDQTDQAINQRIEQQTRANIAFFAEHPERIQHRLDELDKEWDLERRLEMNSAVITLASIALAITRSRWWVLVPLVLQGFFLQHSIQGWCPPLSVLRRMGCRTETEIEAERHALKALRGDFENTQSAQSVVEAVRR